MGSISATTSGPCPCCQSNCALQCRSHSATAYLCGFSEFTDPSVPPKFYKQKNAVGKVNICNFSSPDCQPGCVDPLYPASYHGGGGQQYDPFGNMKVYSASGAAEPVSYDPITGLWTYKITACFAMDVADVPPQDPPRDPQEIAAQVAVGAGLYTLGNTFTLSPCTAYQCAIRVYSGQWMILNASVLWITTPSADESTGGRRDEWASVSDFNPNLPGMCVPTENAGTSQSYTFTSGGCQATTGGTPGAGPDYVLGPLGVYGSAIAITTETKTTRTWTADSCVNGESESQSYTGEIVETLSDEDTADAAIARAEPTPTWGSPASCQTETAFRSNPSEAGEFGYREVQVRGVCGALVPLVMGHSYELTIYFKRRVLGSAGPFLPDSTAVISFTADTVPIDTTDWIDVPNEVGWETKAGGCSLVDVT